MPYSIEILREMTKICPAGVGFTGLGEAVPILAGRARQAFLQATD